MGFRERIVNIIVRIIGRTLFTFDPSPLKQIPMTGPMLLIANHVSVFEGPLIYVYTRPRRMIGLAKKQLWDRLLTRIMMNAWGAIPVDRDLLDRRTMDACFSVLDRGDILCLAPEGTRSRDGTLKEGKAGVAYFACKRQVPIIPVATAGFEQVKKNVKRLKKTPISIYVGKPFEVIPISGRITQEKRQTVAHEMMMRMAELLPDEYRGFYAGSLMEYTMTREVSEASSGTAATTEPSDTHGAHNDTRKSSS